MRIRGWSSDVCSADLSVQPAGRNGPVRLRDVAVPAAEEEVRAHPARHQRGWSGRGQGFDREGERIGLERAEVPRPFRYGTLANRYHSSIVRSEEHTSELQ